MSETSLKAKATSGIIWNAVDKFTAQAGQFVVSVVLARLLMPEDFGLIGMLSIFIVISQTFIDSGMGTGLIQKQDRNEADFSTVFIFNFTVSLLFYLILFFTAPLIAAFYDMPRLVVLTRVLSLGIIINSLTVVQHTKLIIDIDFKTIAIVNVVSVFIAGVVAIFFAYGGWGVWALVVQRILTSIISAIMFWLLNRWKVSLVFSKQSFKQLFGFGSKLLFQGLYARLLWEAYNIFIGKVYSASELGYYTRGKTFADVTSGTVTLILHQVTFPILASLQNDKERLVSVYSRLIRMASFIVLPVMTMLALIAEPLVIILLTDKWIPVIVLLQWLSFARIVHPISVINLNILKAVGRSDLFLKVDISNLPIMIIVLIITVPMGVKAIVIGHAITSAISFFIYAYMPGKMFGYGAIKQLRDMLPVIFATAVMATGVLLLNLAVDSLWIKLIGGSITGALIYLAVCYFLKLEELNEIKIVVAKFIGR